MCDPELLAPKPELTLAKLIREDIGTDVNPQALRMFVRSRWNRLTVLAHAIHRNMEPASLASKQEQPQ